MLSLDVSTAWMMESTFYPEDFTSTAVNSATSGSRHFSRQTDTETLSTIAAHQSTIGHQARAVPGLLSFSTRCRACSSTSLLARTIPVIRVARLRRLWAQKVCGTEVSHRGPGVDPKVCVLDEARKAASSFRLSVQQPDQKYASAVLRAQCLDKQKHLPNLPLNLTKLQLN